MARCDFSEICKRCVIAVFTVLILLGLSVFELSNLWFFAIIYLLGRKLVEIKN